MVKRRKQRKLLAVVLAAAMLIPQSIMTVGAAEKPTSVYEYKEKVTVTNGEGALDASAVADTMNVSEDVTVNLTFTSSGTGVQSFFFMGDNRKANNYIAVYRDGSTLGVESRDANGTQQIKNATYNMGSIDLTKAHTLTFTIDGGSSYSFWIDGEKVKTDAVTCSFNTNLTTSNYVGFGNGSRSSGNSYPFTGTLEKVELYDQALSDAQIKAYHDGALGSVVYEYYNAYYPADQGNYVTASDIDAVKALQEGSVTIRYRVKETDNSPHMLVALSDSSKEKEYLGVYVTPESEKIGFDAPAGGGANGVFKDKSLSLSGKGVSVNNTEWHTLTFTKSESAIYCYVDGVYIDRWRGLGAGFFNLVNNADTLTIGKVTRTSTNSDMNTVGAIDCVKIYSEVLTEDEVYREHESTVREAETVLDMEGAKKTELEDLYYPGYNGSSDYRIPSLLTTKDGTQLAFIDERNSGTQDAGNIDSVVRRKEKGEKEFSDPITLVDLPNNGGSAAFAIDMATVQDQDTGKIFAFVDMFPQSQGLMNTGLLQAGTGYKEVDGEQRQILYKDGAEYGYIGDIEDGIGYVLDKEGNDTGYTVIVYPSEAEASLQEKGNLYKDGAYKGSIYMNAGPDKGDLNVMWTSYLWLVTSEDDGETWSDPIDITPQVKEDWTLFFGTGPGVGIQLHTGEHDGRLVVPIYTANKNVNASQSSAVIYSDDGGESWNLGESPQELRDCDRETMTSGGMLTESQAVQLNNGDVLLFMRNTGTGYGGKVAMATSKDGGVTWTSIEALDDVPDVYCQLSAIHFNTDNGEYVLISNPSGPGARKHGQLRLGTVQADGSIAWENMKDVNTANEKFNYSCLTVTEGDGTANPQFALFYEDDTNGMKIRYFEFDYNYLHAGTTTKTEMDEPELLSKDVQVSGDQVTVDLTFDQMIMAAGEPKLSMEIGEEELTASYESGSGTDTIRFTGTMSKSSGVLKATGVDLTNGYLENMQNGQVAIGEMKLYENTRLDLKDKTVTCSTQHTDSTAEEEDGAASNVIDGNEKTYWHSKWGSTPKLPQWVDIDLGEVKNIYKVDYLPRQNQNNGRIQEYGIEVSTDGQNYTEVAHGTLPNSTDWQEIEFIPVQAKHVRVIGYYAYGGGANESCAIAELKVSEYAEGLIEAGDITTLEKLVEEYGDLKEEKYSDATWSAYANALKAAQMILATEDMPVSQNIIDRTADNLQFAAAALVDISRALDRFEEIKDHEAEYTADSWESFGTWLDEQTDVLNEATTSKSVTDVIVEYSYRLGQLVKKGDKTELEKLFKAYTEDDPLAEDGYDADSWAAYEAALDQAESVLKDENASQEEIDNAVAELTAKRTELKADKDELQTLYDTYSLLKEEDYVKGTYDAMRDALVQADIVLKDENAVPADVKNALNELHSAFDQLKDRPNTAALEILYEEFSQLDLGIYMENGAKKMSDALELAEEVLANPQDEEQVQDAVDKLDEAYKHLIRKTDIQELQSSLEKLQLYDTSKMSTKLRDEIEAAIVSVGEILDNQADLTADQIEAALESVRDLIARADAAIAPKDPSKDDGKTETDGKDDSGKAAQTGDMSAPGMIALAMIFSTAVAVSSVTIRRRVRR